MYKTIFFIRYRWNKWSNLQVTLSTNKPAVSLLEIFPEFVLDSSMSNAAGFQIYGGPRITVLSSKTSQRYRQSQ